MPVGHTDRTLPRPRDEQGVDDSGNPTTQPADPPYENVIGHGPQPLRDEGGDVLRTEARQN
ncbi:hypothetical protein, partial [Streptomyces sp. SID5770]|uniref:hypothetical protein n=1 Tax=Streptomyces sp. SID5770 TaxID=2690308 RepID=UPI001F1665D7